ncbi:hypothetical protein CDAR_489821 [Caerostris darwini]|uniref:Uncharacterized protein n=1 Tax=Caerostris darwini TaxID=1538125 RepID=A0AAV4SUP5_9ARAC|nr:hypothetical protein CDAR_489821 [Caerostris darwini]
MPKSKSSLFTDVDSHFVWRRIKDRMQPTPVAPPPNRVVLPSMEFLQRKCPGTFPGVDKKGFLLFFLHYFFTGESKIDGRPRMFSFRQPNLLLESHWPFSPVPPNP